MRADAGIVATKRVRKMTVLRHIVKRDGVAAALQRAADIAAKMRRRELAMIGLEQQLAVAGLLRERHQFAGAVARQCRLASQIGVDPETPFGLEGRRAVAELLAYLAGFDIGLFGLNTLQAMRDDRRRTKLQPELQPPAQALFQRQSFRELKTCREMRDRFHIGRAAYG